MREVYHGELDEIADKVVEMTRLVATMMDQSTRALLDADLETADRALADDVKIDALRDDLEDRSFSLIAQQQPVATDLRLLISTLHLVADLERMGYLALHIAKIARLREFEREPKRATPFEFFDFGVRRRFSSEWHREVLVTLKREVPQFFKGASDVLFARDLGLVPIGTMAHEYLQTFQTLGVRLRDFQRAALEAWVQEYRGDLGTALTDVVGMDAFLADFDLYFAKLFDGLRHDSGDPFVWGEKALKHYDKLRIDAKTKRLVFSDGLDFEKSFALYRHFADRTMVGFGIGTNLTNDMGLKTLHIVMKLTHANHQPVAKLSDSPGKLLCDDLTFLAYLRQVFNVPA